MAQLARIIGCLSASTSTWDAPTPVWVKNYALTDWARSQVEGGELTVSDDELRLTGNLGDRDG